MRKLGVGVLLGMALHGGAALAGVNEAVMALNAKNFAVAEREASQAATSGDPKGHYLLGIIYQSGLNGPANEVAARNQFWLATEKGEAAGHARLAEMYMRGLGGEKDSEKALSHARKAMAGNVPEGGLLVSVILIGEHLNFIQNGKPDLQRYAALAKRPLAERGVDQEARDALYWSVERGAVPAMNMLSLYLGETVGEESGPRLLQLVGKMRQGVLPPVRQFEQIVRYQQTLGETRTSPKLFKDTLAPAMFAAKVKLCGLSDAKEKTSEMPKLLSIKREGDVQNPTYLPSRYPEYAKAYLISGEWSESWTFESCGRQEAVLLRFKADGLGGASLQSESMSLNANSNKGPAATAH